MKKHKCLLQNISISPEFISFEIDMEQNLINNLRVFWQKNRINAYKIIPSEFNNLIQGGLPLPVRAEAIITGKNIRKKIDPYIVLNEQIGAYCSENNDDEHPDVIRVDFSRTDPSSEARPEDSMLIPAEKGLAVPDPDAENMLPKDQLPLMNGKAAGNTEKKSNKAVLAAILLIVAVLSMIAGVILIPKLLSGNDNSSQDSGTESLSGFKWGEENKTDVIAEYLSSKDYSGLVSYYNEKIYNTDSSGEYSEDITKALDQLADEYTSGKEKYENARNYISTFSQLSSPELSDYANKKLSQLKILHESEEAYNSAKSSFDNGDYVSAIESYLKVGNDSQYYASAKNEIEKSVEQLIKKIGDPKDKNQYQEFINELDSAIALLPDNEKLLNKKEELKKSPLSGDNSGVISEAKRYAESGDYPYAINILNDAMSITGSEELKTVLKEYQTEYEKAVTKEAEELVRSGDADKAMETINNALEVIESDSLSKLCSDIEKSKTESSKPEDDNSANSEAKYDSKTEEITAEKVRFLEFKGSIDKKDEVDEYELTVPVTGSYRFGLGDMVNGFYVSLYVYSSNGDVVEGDYSITNNEGLTCKLSKNEVYTVQISYGQKTGNYTMRVGQQKESIELHTAKTVYDSIEYIDQDNIYYFKPEISGTYRFYFSELQSGTVLSVYVYDSLGYTVSSDYSLSINEGVTCELKADEEYKVYVSYRSGKSGYIMHIGYQNPTVDISGKNTISGKIDFKDQDNKYTLTPKKSETYKFALDNMKSGFAVQMYVYDSLGYVVASDSSMSNGDSLKDISLEAGKTYTIYISYRSSLGDYKLDISTQ